MKYDQKKNYNFSKSMSLFSKKFKPHKNPKPNKVKPDFEK